MNLLREIERIGDIEQKAATAMDVRNVPLSERLKQKIQYHEEQITKIKETLQLLEKNKDFEKLLFYMSEVH